MGITLSSKTGAPPTGEAWKAALATAIRDPDELVTELALPDALREPARTAARRFPLVAPRGFVARMRPGDPSDPLLLQVLPVGDEEASGAPGTADPVGDRQATVRPGTIRKYAGRALLVAAGTCAVHCRYCFRRHYPYDETPRGLAAWEPAIDHLSGDPSVSEAILSGGDPLVLSDTFLERLVDRLAAIPHLERLRVHTRLPIVIPERVTAGLIRWLLGTRLAPIFVVHANHPAEIEGECAEAIRRLVRAGVPVLNQSVLLRRVNDDPEVLAELSRRLVRLGAMPYYLHQLDRVAGALHFEVPERRGRDILAELRRRLPGYAVPRYVRETPGAPSKVEIGGG